MKKFILIVNKSRHCEAAKRPKQSPWKRGVCFVVRHCFIGGLLAMTTLSFAMPDQTEIAIGRAVDEKIKKQYGVYDNQDVLNYIKSIGLSIVNVSCRRDMVYRFTVLDTDKVDSIASPGGYVYITKGFLKSLDNEAQLAASLATEIVHIARRHGIADIEKKMQPDNKTVSTKKDELIRGVNAAWEMIDLGLNKKLQFEADMKGAEWILDAGYDPEAMIKMLDVIQVLEKKNRKIVADFVARHYKTTRRIDSINLMLKNLRSADPLKYDSAKGKYYPERYKTAVLDVISSMENK